MLPIRRRLLMRKFLLALAVFATLTAAPALAGKEFASYDKAKLDALIKSGAPVVVHVHADWCPTCRRQITVFDKLFDEPRFAKIATVRVNYDKDRGFLAAYKVTKQATILAFKGGKEVARLIYDADSARIRSTVAAAL
jgi:thiol-disulfide isomerase/thioredoxin